MNFKLFGSRLVFVHNRKKFQSQVHAEQRDSIISLIRNALQCESNVFSLYTHSFLFNKAIRQRFLGKGNP